MCHCFFQLRSPTPVSTDQVEGVSVPSETQSQQEETPTEVAESDSAQLGSDKPARKTNERSVKSASKNRKVQLWGIVWHLNTLISE